MKFNSYLLLIIIMTSCHSGNYRFSLFESEEFNLYNDKVVQGVNVAHVESPHHITSNYESPSSQTYSSLIRFKFSINEKDNELPVGIDHWVAITDDEKSPIIKFGENPEPISEAFEIYLSTNYKYTFRADMSPVIDSFEELGYYESYDGTRIAKEDFKGFYIAGNAEPLCWDFVNLGNHGLKMKDTGQNNIYEITLILNPFKKEDYSKKEWKLSTDISNKPSYQSNVSIVDALFNMSLEEALMNIEEDSTLRTGAKWGGVWTRDISYSIFLAFAYHEPEIAKISLMKKVRRDRIVQDTGSGGAWPVSSDRTTWAIAAWEIYKVTGDKEWLATSNKIIKNSLEDDYRVLASSETGMYKGESSFLDWREQTYPKWMSNMDIYVSQNLGTNVVHYQAHIILSKMARALGEDDQEYLDRAEQIKSGINEYLWNDDKGYYAQYLYGRNFMNRSDRFEALGEALAVLFDVADEKQSISIFEKSPLTPFGVTCIYPQIPNIPPYHNNGVWPFVQSYWNLAAAKAGNEKVLDHGLASLYRAGGLFLTNYENFVAQTGDFVGTEINSHRMLWSMAGNLAMVHRVFIGMNFEEDGIRLNPVIPRSYDGTRTLSNFKYRDAILDITVSGYGKNVRTVKLNGNDLPRPFLSALLTGRHTITVIMDNEPFDDTGINMVENKFSLPNPQTRLEGSTIKWDSIRGAVSYNIYKDGSILGSTYDTQTEVDISVCSEYKVSAVDQNNFESFTSEPLMTSDVNKTIYIQTESFAAKSNLPYTNYSGRGFVEISNGVNREINLNVRVNDAGTYVLDFRYSNGSGPWNTDNKCAIRSLYVNDEYKGAIVFPQRGTDEWSDWGYSNSFKVKLKSGNNRIKVVFEESNINMNVEVNIAMLDHLRIIPL